MFPAVGVSCSKNLTTFQFKLHNRTHQNSHKHKLGRSMTHKHRLVHMEIGLRPESGSIEQNNFETLIHL